MDYNDEIHSDDWHAREVDSPVAIKIITAQEACQRTQDNINKNVSAELVKVMKKIHEEIKAGCYELYEEGTLYADTKEKLKALGYIVTCDLAYNIAYNHPCYTISWKPEGYND